MPRIDAKALNLGETVIKVSRVAKVVKGGKRFNFRALVVVGDKNGHVGMGLGKAAEVPDAIRKATEDAKKRLIAVPLMGTTIPYQVTATFAASEVLLKPAAPGTGVIAGGAVRAVVEAAGIRDILSKSLGHSELNTVQATILALRDLHAPDTEAQRRNRSLADLVGPKMAARYAEAAALQQATSPEAERPERPERGGRRGDRDRERGGGDRGGRGGRGGGDRGGRGAGPAGGHGPGPRPQASQPPPTQPTPTPSAPPTMPPANSANGASEA